MSALRLSGLSVVCAVYLATTLTVAGCSDNSADEQQAGLTAEVARLKDRVGEVERQLATTQGEKDGLQVQLELTKAALQRAEASLAAQDFTGTKQALDAAIATLQELIKALAAFPASVRLEVKFAFDQQPFELDTAYPLAEGATVSFTEVRYWLSNVKFLRADGSTALVPNAYYLVEAMKAQTLVAAIASQEQLPQSRRETIELASVTTGVYSGIEFAVGVDAEHNDNLWLGGGELNVLKNMTSQSWNWFTSYIFSKMRATYTAGPSAPIALAWDTGSNANYRIVKKTFDAPIEVSSSRTTKVALRANMKALFASLEPARTPNIGAGQAAQRTVLADNWSSAFELVSATSSVP